MNNEVCLNAAFAEDDDSIDDVLNQEYAKGYEQGRRKELKICVWSKEHNYESLKDYTKRIRADAIEEIREAITNNGAYQMNPQITEYDKGSDDAFEIVLNILEQLKERSNEQ